MNEDLIGLLFKFSIPLILFFSWLYKKNRNRVELRVAAAAIMNDKFSVALNILVKVTQREIAELKSGSLTLPSARMQEKLRLIWVMAEGIGGCLEKVGRPASTAMLTSAIQWQIRLVSQRRIIKAATKTTEQKSKWREVTQQHEKNVALIVKEWGRLQKQMRTVKT